MSAEPLPHATPSPASRSATLRRGDAQPCPPGTFNPSGGRFFALEGTCSVQRHALEVSA